MDISDASDSGYTQEITTAEYPYSYQSYADDANRLTSNMTSMRYTFNGILTFCRLYL